jgi:protocatechuate 3,4-dioxygenase beta subunit
MTLFVHWRRAVHTRRGFCELAGLGVVAHVVGCSDDDSNATSAGTSSEGGDDDGDDGDATTNGDADASESAADSSTAVDSGGSDRSDGSDGSSSVDGGTTTDTVDTGGSSETGEVLCEPSPPSIEGPFYRPGMPIRSDLDIYGDEGLPVHMSGRVLDSSCQPVANAVVEIWHAAPIPPDTEPEAFDATYDNTREFRYYGQVATDAEGRYEFETLRPGWYLNGAQYRPAHIHVKIWTGEEERLTSQLYFVDDPFADVDPWFDPAMVLELDENGAVEFDFAI